MSGDGHLDGRLSGETSESRWMRRKEGTSIKFDSFTTGFEKQEERSIALNGRLPEPIRFERVKRRAAN